MAPDLNDYVLERALAGDFERNYGGVVSHEYARKFLLRSTPPEWSLMRRPRAPRSQMKGRVPCSHACGAYWDELFAGTLGSCQEGHNHDFRR